MCIRDRLYTLRSMDYFLRYAVQLTILVDAKAIIFLRLCKDSSGILLRFSLEISRYNAEIHHVSGENNFISDIHHNTGIVRILQEKKHVKYLSEQQAEDGIRDFCLSRGLGDVYKRQVFA